MADKQYIYIVRIEGIGVDVSGTPTQVSYCYKGVPSYADASYIPGLAEPPKGVSSRWNLLDNTVSVGRFTLQFRPGLTADPLNWFLTAPDPISEMRETQSSVDLTFNHALTNTDSGITAGKMLYLNRETVHVTTATGGLSAFSATRAVCGSRAARFFTNSPEVAAETYYAGTDIFEQPPALTGRKVEVFQVLASAASAGSETKILQGFINSEVAAGTHWPTIECVERIEGTINDEPLHCQAWLFINMEGSYSQPLYDGEDWEPIGNTSGGYVWHGEIRGLFPALRGTNDWKIDYSRPVYIEDDEPPVFTETVEDLTTQYVLWSDKDGDYPPFYYDDGSEIADDHGITIFLNCLMSDDGTNFDAAWIRSYDRGTHENINTGARVAGGLFPRYSLAIPAADVDIDSFELAREEMAGFRAKRLFLGLHPIQIRELSQKLFGFAGYVVGTTASGTWKIIRLQDVYGTEGVTAFTNVDVIRPASWAHQTQGRPLDRIMVETGPAPDGGETTTFPVKEATSRNYYPRHMGAVETHSDLPYSAEDWADPNAPLVQFVANRITRFANRVQFVTFVVKQSHFGTVEIGDKVSVIDSAIRSPVTGNRNETVTGMVVGIDFDCRDRASTITLASTNTGHVAQYCPSAELDGGSQTTTTYTVQDHVYTDSNGDEDALSFTAGGVGVGDVVVLLDDHLVLRSDATQGVYVTSITSSTLTLNERFEASGVPITGNDEDVITFAGYDDVNSGQQTINGYQADGGAAGSGVPALGSGDDVAYVWGD